MRVALNADLGEGFGPWRMGDDAALLPWIDSASLACGFHAGDPETMSRAVRQVAAAGVSLGAHPGFADLLGFGRRKVAISPGEIPALIAYQVGALQAICVLAGQRVTHVKPHGALYNMAAADPALAEALVGAVAGLDRGLILVAPAGSALAAAAEAAGVVLAAEGFCDRGYEADASLSPRDQPGAVIADPAEAAARAVAMVRDQAVVTRGGKRIPTRIDTLCLHGDGADAVALARAVAEALAGAGIARAALPELGLG
ncbi:LamB/YcsF family protein [Phaeospirillum tilakii]|uniref:5-oxoprolinase subunit A n=1 Tax=Phaeospirillum tilakii TaxID=741673 RepID=A0ABW5CGS4_9PROT